MTSFTETNGIARQSGANFNFNSSANKPLGIWIPEVWASQFYEDLMAALVMASPMVVNRNYEGHFSSQGDTVRIPHSASVVNVADGYTPYGEVGSPDRPELDSLVMRINRAATFGFEVDDLHQAQTASGVSLMETLVKDAARATAEKFDKNIVDHLLAAINGKDLNNSPTANLHGKVATVPTAADGAALYEAILKARTILDINNVPTEGRYMLTGPAEYSWLLKHEMFIDASRYGAGSVVTNGEVGRVLGLSVRVSNTIGAHFKDTSYKDLPGVTGTQVGVRGTKNKGVAHEGIQLVVGHNSAITHAEQLSALDTYRPEKKFTSAVKGLVVWGTKVIRPEALVVGTIPPAAP